MVNPIPTTDTYIGIPYTNGWDREGCSCGALVLMFYEEHNWDIGDSATGKAIAIQAHADNVMTAKILLKCFQSNPNIRREYDPSKLEYGDILIFGEGALGGCGIYLDKDWVLTTGFGGDCSRVVSMLDLVAKLKVIYTRVIK